MTILLSNDDGIEAEGLRALEEAAADLGDVWTVAPSTEQSARSHALTMHEPLRISRMGEQRFAVTGTPADSVYLGVHHILPSRPQLLLSGINRGSNLSNDVVYSGTVAAAREAAAVDIAAVAVSLWVRSDTPHWETAQHVAKRVARTVMARGLPSRTLLNVNVPDVPLAELKGIRVAPLGRRYYHFAVAEKIDPRGRKYYWIGGDHDRFEDLPDTDGPLCERGYAVVTPLQMDLTAHDMMAAVRTWGLED